MNELKYGSIWVVVLQYLPLRKGNLGLLELNNSMCTS